jgi:hypothetical protein
VISGTSPDGTGQRVEAIEAALDEIVAQKQVAGRVAAEKKLRGEDQFRALVDRLAIGLLQARAIFVERADGGVELEEADAHEEF